MAKAAAAPAKSRRLALLEEEIQVDSAQASSTLTPSRGQSWLLL